MVPKQCWEGDIEISPLIEFFDNDPVLRGFCHEKEILSSLQFIPTTSRDASVPFPPDITPKAIALLNHNALPLWLFAEPKWTLQTSSSETNHFFHTLLTSSPSPSLLLTHAETNILIYPHHTSNKTILQAQLLHPPTLLTAIQSTKRESPPPDDPFTSYAGQLISILSPVRVSREMSSQVTAKLESPGRVDAKSRRVRRVERLLPDLARRKKEMMQIEEGERSVTREGSVMSGRVREGSVVSVARTAREASVVRTREGSVRRSMGDSQTREAVRQIVIAALRLHQVELSEDEYKSVIAHTVQAGMFALRGKLKAGRNVGMGEIGEVVESLLKIFLVDD